MGSIHFETIRIDDPVLDVLFIRAQNGTTVAVFTVGRAGRRHLEMVKQPITFGEEI